jgi:hypothetical protein
LLDVSFYSVGCKHLNCAVQRRLRQGMGIHSQEERSTGPLRLAKLRDRLADSKDMVFS